MNRISFKYIPTFALILAGCSVGPNYQRPETKSAKTWGEADSSVVTTQPTTQPSKTTTQPAQLETWWKAFKDPTLDSLIERAVDANLDLKVATERVREARAQRGVTAAVLWPTLDASGAYSYQGSSKNVGNNSSTELGPGKQLRNAAVNGAFNGLAGGSSTISGKQILVDSVQNTVNNKLSDTSTSTSRGQNLFSAGFDAGWEIDVFGGNRRAVEAADADIDAYVESRHDVLVTLLSEVALNYVELRGAQQRLIIARENIVLQKDTVDLTQVRYKAGFVSELDIAQAQALLANTEAEVPTLETSIRQSIYQLSLLLAQQPDALLKELESVKPIPTVPPRIPVGLPSDLLRRRPDIRTAERQLAASTARIGEATADLFPKFSLTGSVGPQSSQINNLFDRNSFGWSVGPAVSWPVFDGWKIRSNIEVTNAQQAQALATYQQTVLSAFKEVESDLVAYRNEQLRYEKLSQAVSASQRSTDLSQELYMQGLTAFLDVLTAQKSLYSNQDSLIQSQITVTTNLISLYKALGGGWEQMPEPYPKKTNDKK
jgi:NodT family efflux transporter outer membrane factor (OMF) lipoprotein